MSPTTVFWCLAGGAVAVFVTGCWYTNPDRTRRRAIRRRWKSWHTRPPG